MKKKIQGIIIDELREATEDDIELITDTTIIFGQEGIVNSIGLVSFIVAVEQRVEDEFNVSITLADERAMSQKNSPFRTVATLTDYIVMLLGK